MPDHLPSTPRSALTLEEPVPIPSAGAGQTWVTRVPWLSPDPDRTSLRATGHAVLVVDDDHGVLRLTARILRLEGYTVLEAASGADALLILDHQPDVRLVLTDVVMPEMHGLDLAATIMERAPRPTVILMTGHAAELSGRLESRDPSLPLLLKPFTSQQLIKTVRMALGNARH